MRAAIACTAPATLSRMRERGRSKRLRMRREALPNKFLGTPLHSSRAPPLLSLLSQRERRWMARRSLFIVRPACQTDESRACCVRGSGVSCTPKFDASSAAASQYSTTVGRVRPPALTRPSRCMRAAIACTAPATLSRMRQRGQWRSERLNRAIFSQTFRALLSSALRLLVPSLAGREKVDGAAVALHPATGVPDG